MTLYCHWCNDPIIEENIFNIKFFYNHGWHGYPICNWCSDDLKTNGEEPMEILRKRLGLESVKQKQQTLDKWL